MKLLLAIALFSASASAAVLDTPHYVVDISPQCEEGNVSCDRVVYRGKSKRSGHAITLQGHSWHSRYADGVTPCRFLGYRFENGDVTYYVHEQGRLRVVRDRDEVLVNEQGRWLR